MILRDKYSLAKCCSPVESDRIVGYFSYDDRIKVHRHDCGNLAKAEPDRLVRLDWSDIRADASFEPDGDYSSLDETDFAILRHHRDYDIDYSLMVAKVLNLERQTAFERHQKLRNLGLVERVDALMIRYRRKTAKNKWIKHRNHTYYGLTDKGRAYLDYHLSQSR